jgi:hypothetical protein
MFGMSLRICPWFAAPGESLCLGRMFRPRATVSFLTCCQWFGLSEKFNGNIDGFPVNQSIDAEVFLTQISENTV